MDQLPDSLTRGPRIPLNQRVQALLEEMRYCLSEKKHLNFSEPAHREITEALHTLVYEEAEGPNEARLKVIYSDGSAGTALPVRCLRIHTVSALDEERALHVGTLSFRHLNYDNLVDYYLIRDRETRALSNGEVDELAYLRMKELLEDPFLQRDGAQVVIYQTGLEPLTVGMYRAIIEHLLDRRRRHLPTLALQPVFYVDPGEITDRGSIWA